MSSLKSTDSSQAASAEQLPNGLIVSLNELIAMCHNGERGYALACDRVDSEVLRGLFEAYARQRGEFAELLRQEVLQLGGTPETGGDLAGTLHRLWIRWRRALAASDATIVAECLTGDAAALEVYEEARQGIAASPLEELIDQQYEAIRAAHGRLHSLLAGGQLRAGTRDERRESK
ncbi:MAG: PA2169 family four-helix-bundle protein [Anaerolineae bacterium]|nr:PA2169 family four-helix-bundle protein [Anaerolineae bacterium]